MYMNIVMTKNPQDPTAQFQIPPTSYTHPKPQKPKHGKHNPQPS